MVQEDFKGSIRDTDRTEAGKQSLAHGDGFFVFDGVACRIDDGAGLHISLIVRVLFELLHREGVFDVLHEGIPGGEVEVFQFFPFLEAGDCPLLGSFVGIDELDDGGMTFLHVLFDGRDNGGHLHGRNDLVPEALIRAPEFRHGGRYGLAVHGASSIGVLHSGQSECRIDVSQYTLPGPGHFVVDFPLRRGEGVLEAVVLDVFVSETSCRIDSHGLHVLGDHLHDADSTTGDVLHESLCTGKGRLVAPKTEPCGVGEVHDFRGAGRGYVEDPGLREKFLQFDTGKGGRGGLRHAPLALHGHGVPHVVRFVEGDHAVEVFAEPLHDLLQAGDLLSVCGLFHFQGAVPDKPDALGLIDVGVQLRLADVEKEVRVPPDALNIPGGVLNQGGVLRDPEGLLSALVEVVPENSGDFPAFSDTRAVTDEIAFAGSVGQSLGVRLAGVDHGLELRQGDLAVLDGFFRDVGCVSGVNRFDRRHGGRFDQLAGMRLCVGDA